MRQQRDVVRSVQVRTKDDVAVIQDLPQGRNQLGHGFPVTPTFDALSYFTLSWRVGAHQDVTASVHDVTPMTYADPSASRADIVVTRLRSYRAQYAPDSSDAPGAQTHVTLAPLDFFKNQYNPDTTFYFNDLYIDNASGLPSRVILEGSEGKQFVLDYGSVEGHWVLTHIHYEEVLHGPLRVGRLHVIADVVYDKFTFPELPPDPRLAG
jgi:hypothetical protein